MSQFHFSFAVTDLCYCCPGPKVAPVLRYCLHGQVWLRLQPRFSMRDSILHHPWRFGGFLGCAQDVFDEMHVGRQEL
jgi:hypothetical protein